jgi:hypothetical protein
MSKREKPTYRLSESSELEHELGISGTRVQDRMFGGLEGPVGCLGSLRLLVVDEL